MQFLFLENHSADNKLLYMASFDLQKTNWISSGRDCEN